MSDRSMGVLQEADEERKRRRENPDHYEVDLVGQLREENARLRQRVEELERAARALLLHDDAADAREGLPSCREADDLREIL